jgi:hypothetical protein
VDSLSRVNQVLEAEWTLQEVVFRGILALFPEIKVDLFATFENKKLPAFVSPCPDDRALAVDAFSIPWDGLAAYAFPPIRLIAAVLQKIQEDKCYILLVAPAWAGQAWFPTILSLLIDYPRRLPIQQKLLSQKGGRMFHSNPSQLNLHAWPLSSDPYKRRVFLERCHKELPSLIDSQPGLYTTLAFQSSLNGLTLAKDLWKS